MRHCEPGCRREIVAHVDPQVLSNHLILLQGQIRATDDSYFWIFLKILHYVPNPFSIDYAVCVCKCDYVSCRVVYSNVSSFTYVRWTDDQLDKIILGHEVLRSIY